MVPVDDTGLTEPVDIMIRIGEGDQPGQQDTGAVRKYINRGISQRDGIQGREMPVIADRPAGRDHMPGRKQQAKQYRAK